MMNCLIVDDDPLSIFALSKIIESGFPEWTVLTAATLHDALQRITEQTIDFIVLDLVLGDESGMTLLAYLQQHSRIYPCQCIVVSNVNDPDKIATCKKLGAHGYVQKKDACRAVPSVIHELLAAARKPLQHASAEALGDSIRLTHRQRDIIDLLLAGYSNKMIAHALNLSYGTVKNYMFDLMRLTSVNSRLEMAMKLQRSGYTPRKHDRVETRGVMDGGVVTAGDHAKHGPQRDLSIRF